MSTGNRLRFYHSQAWKKARAAYVAYRKAIDGGLCEECHEEIGDTVHHIVWLTENNLDDLNVSLSFDNLKLVCRDCHAKEEDPNGDQKANRKGRYFFDANGNVIRNEKAKSE